MIDGLLDVLPWIALTVAIIQLIFTLEARQ